MTLNPADVRKLADLLKTHQATIAVQWAELTRKLPQSKYASYKVAEISRTTRLGTQAIIEFISTDSCTIAEEYIATVSQVRLQQGFDIQEVIEGILLARQAILPYVIQTFPPGSPSTLPALFRLDESLRYIVSRFGHLYAEAANHVILEKQTENARLIDQLKHVAVMEERNRIARELHDSVTQSLYGVTLYAEAAARVLNAGDPEGAHKHLRDLRSTAEEALREMRLLIFELRPPVLEKEGLVAALQARLDAVEGRAGLETEFKVDGDIHLPEEIEEGLYRIALEALNNALKHACAHKIIVALHQRENKATMEITDDGCGFNPETAINTGGFGLKGMQERTTQFGGILVVSSSPTGGTHVHVEARL